MRRTLQAFVGMALVPLVLAACGGSGSTSAAGGSAGTATTVTYWLWDANQLPAYQQCATDFHAANPGVTVKITQLGWDDYWSKLTTSLVSGTAPDVFTDHLQKYPEFVSKHTILPIDDLVSRDKVDTGIYEPGLANLWVGQDGRRYGLPKDWDAIGVFYNKKMTDAAGITAQQLATMTWNPQDGGSYEKIIAHLTTDKKGKRGDEPGFDKNDVAVYGLGLDAPLGSSGQTQWSMYAAANGWTYTDKNPWGTHYNYGDPKFVQTINWWKSLIDQGYMPSLKAATGAKWNDMIAAGKIAMGTSGSWMLSSVFGGKSATFTPAVAPLPVGPDGKRASMFNGLSDSIYAGTKHKDAAWQWMKYLASPACENAVAQHAVVFPAIPAAVDVAQKQFEAKGIDVSAFTVNVKDKTTFLMPITDHAAEVEAIIKPALEAVLSGTAPAASLGAANTQVNALFQG
jgi:multiple sugar transport system substrate-binding protein